MQTLNDILIEQLDRMDRIREGEPLSIIETGTIRNEAENYEQDDGWSTLTFARYAADHRGSVTSIDLDVSHARAVLSSFGPCRGKDEREWPVTLVQGYSVEVLAGFLKNQEIADVVLLDSDNDAQLIMHEFYLAKELLRLPGVIMVDDVEPGSETVVKGRAVIDWLEARRIPYEVRKRQGLFYSTGVLIVELM